jgi:hypothetical protein
MNYRGLYRFTVTSSVKDVAGNAFVPWQSVFTTGSTSTPGTIAFDKSDSGASGEAFTSVIKGPDGKLYAATLDGYIERYTIAADGTLTGRQEISTVRNNASAQGLPAITNNNQAETDYVFDVKKGSYYGHPNPARCEWVLAGANPTARTDPFEITDYPVGTPPDRNLDLADMYDAGLHASADGAIEYRGNAFGGALKGKLLVVRYSNGQDIETFDVASTGQLSNRTTGIVGFTGFQQPLDLTEDTATGNLYVTEMGTLKIILLKPRTASGVLAIQNLNGVPFNDRLVFNRITNPADSAQKVRDGGLKRWKQFQRTSRRTLLLAFCSPVYASDVY